MLFVITHSHTAEICPDGPFNPRPDWMTNIHEKAREAKLDIVSGYAAPQGHLFWFVVETASAEALMTFCRPLEEVGDVVATPVLPIEQAHEWAKRQENPSTGQPVMN